MASSAAARSSERAAAPLPPLIRRTAAASCRCACRRRLSTASIGRVDTERGNGDGSSDWLGRERRFLMNEVHMRDIIGRLLQRKGPPVSGDTRGRGVLLLYATLAAA